jgi:hypothetical protein
MIPKRAGSLGWVHIFGTCHSRPAHKPYIEIPTFEDFVNLEKLLGFEPQMFCKELLISQKRAI